MEEEKDRYLHLKFSELAWKRRWTDLYISRLVSSNGEEVDRSLHLKFSELAWKRRWTDLFISRLVRLHGRGVGQISSSQG